MRSSKRTGELVAVQLHPVGSTDASAHPVAFEPARTRVGGGHEREPRRELHRSHGAGDHDAAVLERLSQSFDGVAAELGELVEEEDAVMREAHLSRPHVGASPAEQPDGGDGVMRRAERASAKQPPRSAEQSRDGMELRRFERFLPRELGEDRRQAPSEHRLAGAGRTDHQEVVAAGRRDLQGAARLRLTAYLREVDGRGGRRVVARDAPPPAASRSLEGNPRHRRGSQRRSREAPRPGRLRRRWQRGRPRRPGRLWRP